MKGEARMRRRHRVWGPFSNWADKQPCDTPQHHLRVTAHHQGEVTQAHPTHSAEAQGHISALVRKTRASTPQKVSLFAFQQVAM